MAIPLEGTPGSRHQVEAQINLEHWRRKPVLREVYGDFHRAIAQCISKGIEGEILEIGSGIGNIRDVIPACIRTDMFPSPWIDRVENVYELSCGDQTLSHIILFDVFHHLRYPGSAFRECRRVLVKGGRLIVFEPYVSLAGRSSRRDRQELERPLEYDFPCFWTPRFL